MLETLPQTRWPLIVKKHEYTANGPRMTEKSADNHARPFFKVFLRAVDQLTHLPRDIAFAEREVAPARRQHVHLRPAEVQAGRLAGARHLQGDGGDGVRGRYAVRHLDRVAVVLAHHLDRERLKEI